jgi:hypothetical protein
MEKSGDQKHRYKLNRDLDIRGRDFNVDNRTGLDRSGDVAAKAREQAFTILIGYLLANHRIRRCCDHEEYHQKQYSPPQATIFSLIT